MPHSLDLTDRVAVVIGGTSGLGRAMGVGLAEHGVHVVPCGRRQQNVESACREIEALGRRTVRRPGDVRDRESLNALRDAVLERLGGVDILVNAAGYTHKQATAEVGESQWSALIDTNVTGALAPASRSTKR
jgi:NAD(P)-dependent dehydrogenase (short-subunit alcohol dehydrogenase family)